MAHKSCAPNQPSNHRQKRWRPTLSRSWLKRNRWKKSPFNRLRRKDWNTLTNYLWAKGLVYLKNRLSLCPNPSGKRLKKWRWSETTWNVPYVVRIWTLVSRQSCRVAMSSTKPVSLHLKNLLRQGRAKKHVLSAARSTMTASRSWRAKDATSLGSAPGYRL